MSPSATINHSANKKRIAFVISGINKALSFEWIAARLDDQAIRQIYILLNTQDSDLEQHLLSKGHTVYRIPYAGKKHLPGAIWHCIRILRSEKVQTVHSHLFDANVVGLTAAIVAGVRRRIYTRHHSTLHHIYFPRAVYYDRIINAMATDIIAISGNVADVLLIREGVKPDKIHLIHHGFDLAEFESVEPARTTLVADKYRIGRKNRPVVGVIARFTEWKGIQHIIPAFKRILSNQPSAVLVLANAKGDFAPKIKELLGDLPEDNYRLIDFEADLPALYSVFDCYVHTPIDSHSEAFGQTYVEALASGTPSVFTLSGIAQEFIGHEKNALVVEYQSPAAIAEAVERVLQGGYPKAWIEKGKSDVSQKFGIDRMIEQLHGVYLDD